MSEEALSSSYMKLIRLPASLAIFNLIYAPPLQSRIIYFPRFSVSLIFITSSKKIFFTLHINNFFLTRRRDSSENVFLKYMKRRISYFITEGWGREFSVHLPWGVILLWKRWLKNTEKKNDTQNARLHAAGKHNSSRNGKLE